MRSWVTTESLGVLVCVKQLLDLTSDLFFFSCHVLVDPHALLPVLASLGCTPFLRKGAAPDSTDGGGRRLGGQARRLFLDALP